jgi:ATP-dependent exoDNAse (exonuclease V) alpha subunit
MVSLPEAVPEQGSARTGGVPEQGSARTGGVPEQGSARTGGVPEEAVIRIEGCDEKILATRLYPTRREVQELNQRELEKLLAAQALSHSYQAHDVLHEKKGRRNLPVTPAQREMLNKCTMAPDTLILAVGAQVMLIKNLDVPAGLVNGSRGVVLGYNAQDYPLVMFDNGHELPLGPAQFETDLGKQLLVRSQIPLILAWALTIHKCQGSTLTQVVTDLTGTFAESQIYVTLSRVRSLDGLYLEGINYRMIKCHPLVKAYYAQLAHHQAPKPMPTVDPPALSADERDNPILPLLV